MKGRLKKELTLGILAAALGAAAVFARRIVFSQWVGLFSDKRDIWVRSSRPRDILLFLGFSAAAFLILRLILRAGEKRPPKEQAGPDKSRFLLFFAVILLAQIPCLLTYFPGGVYADTIPSLQIARGEAPFSNRQPILYAFYWMLFVKPGQWFGFSDTAVFFLHTVSVAVLYALSAAWFLSVARKHGTHRILVGGMTAYLALFPLIPLYLVSLWKDTPFSIAVFAFSTFLLDVLWEKDPAAWLKCPRRLFLYAVLAFFFTFLRNNAVYAFVLFSAAVFLYYLKKDKRAGRRFGLLSLALLLPFCVVRGAISSSAESVESLGIPLQQVGYVLQESGKIGEEDRAFLEQILPAKRWKEVYRPLCADTVKWDDAFDTVFFREHTGEFLRVWLRIVRDNFPMAVESYLLSTVGFWDPGRQMPHGYVCNSMWEGEDLPAMRDLPKEWTGVSLAGFYDGLPLFSAALFAWAVLILTVLGTLRHRRPSFLAVLPALGIWLTVLIATPIAFSLRYLFPFVLLVPPALTIFFQPGEAGSPS